jgi:hypothetical protein
VGHGPNLAHQKRAVRKRAAMSDAAGLKISSLLA